MPRVHHGAPGQLPGETRRGEKAPGRRTGEKGPPEEAAERVPEKARPGQAAPGKILEGPADEAPPGTCPAGPGVAQPKRRDAISERPGPGQTADLPDPEGTDHCPAAGTGPGNPALEREAPGRAGFQRL